MEIELAAGESEVNLPPELKVIREVTEEEAFSNHAIALNRGKLPA